MSKHFEVLIVGAGISGLGAAWYLKHKTQTQSFAILDDKVTFGGTWVQHQYPGVRSDSDLYTFGYSFKPWINKPIATGEEIMRYLGELIDENGFAGHIHYQRKIVAANWSSVDKCWILDVLCLDTEERQRFTCKFLWMCQGYYDHGKGYTPEWKGFADYAGKVVHPQHWDASIDFEGKRVVVIGSGATAATLIPSLAKTCAHVTMLQRSANYYGVARNGVDLADELARLQVPPEWMHEIMRRKMLVERGNFLRIANADINAAKAFLLGAVTDALDDKSLVAKHFTPRHSPLEQRVAFVPDGDFFKAINSGRASVVTDEIDSFTTTGIKLNSGKHLEADVVVTATGFQLSVMGGIPFEVDGKAVKWNDTVGWNTALFTGVPNLVWTVGYVRWSWTLRVDVLGNLVARLLNHMKARGASVVTPELRPEDHAMDLKPWVDPNSFNPGFLLRSLHQMPKQGSVDPWRQTQDFEYEREYFPKIDFEDGTLVFR